MFNEVTWIMYPEQVIGFKVLNSEKKNKKISFLKTLKFYSFGSEK